MHETCGLKSSENLGGGSSSPLWALHCSPYWPLGGPRSASSVPAPGCAAETPSMAHSVQPFQGHMCYLWPCLSPSYPGTDLWPPHSPASHLRTPLDLNPLHPEKLLETIHPCGIKGLDFGKWKVINSLPIQGSISHWVQILGHPSKREKRKCLFILRWPTTQKTWFHQCCLTTLAV